MHSYELMVIFHPDLDDEAINQALDKIKGLISAGKGKVIKVNEWGKRHLAYPIQKQNDGIYYLLDVEMPPSLNKELERNMNILEPVMRYLLTAQEGNIKSEKEQLTQK